MKKVNYQRFVEFLDEFEDDAVEREHHFEGVLDVTDFYVMDCHVANITRFPSENSDEEIEYRINPEHESQ